MQDIAVRAVNSVVMTVGRRNLQWKHLGDPGAEALRLRRANANFDRLMSIRASRSLPPHSFQRASAVRREASGQPRRKTTDGATSVDLVAAVVRARAERQRVASATKGSRTRNAAVALGVVSIIGVCAATPFWLHRRHQQLVRAMKRIAAQSVKPHTTPSECQSVLIT